MKVGQADLGQVSTAASHVTNAKSPSLTFSEKKKIIELNIFEPARLLITGSYYFDQAAGF